MKIVFPDWAKEKAKHNTIMILIGNELVAHKKPREDWQIKKVRCNQCGECCLDVFDLTPFGSDDEGKCNALKKEGDKWICTAGANKPFRCLSDPNKGNVSDCCIEYE